MANFVKVSVVQAATAAFSLPDTLDKLEKLTRLAKERDGAQLVVFPEALSVQSNAPAALLADRRRLPQHDFAASAVIRRCQRSALS